MTTSSTSSVADVIFTLLSDQSIAGMIFTLLNRIKHINTQGSPAKVRPIYIFDGNI